jgi:hypothetical protein
LCEQPLNNIARKTDSTAKEKIRAGRQRGKILPMIAMAQAFRARSR